MNGEKTRSISASFPQLNLIREHISGCGKDTYLDCEKTIKWGEDKLSNGERTHISCSHSYIANRAIGALHC